MTETFINTKPQVLINTRTVVQDAFTNPSVHLFLPTDQLGNMICPSKAARMECWRPAERRARSTLSTVFNTNTSGLAYSLLKHVDEGQYSLLTMSIAFGSISVLNDWLHTLERYPQGDVIQFEVFTRSGDK